MRNFQSRYGRAVELGQKVKVYRNLNNGLLSIVDTSTDLVLGYCEAIQLFNVTFKVSQKGRERVLKEKRKNVHAYVLGYVEDTVNGFNATSEATYNPYKYESFVDVKTKEEISQAHKVQVHMSGRILYE